MAIHNTVPNLDPSSLKLFDYYFSVDINATMLFTDSQILKLFSTKLEDVSWQQFIETVSFCVHINLLVLRTKTNEEDVC